MTEEFYICHRSYREGPLDMLAVLKKIKSGRIDKETLLARSETAVPVPAGDDPLLAHLFREEAETGKDDAEPDAPQMLNTLQHLMSNSWRVTTSEPLLCAAAGGIILLTFIISAFAYLTGGPVAALLAGGFTYFYMHYLYIGIALKLNRGQRLSSEEIGYILSGQAGGLGLTSLTFAFATMMAFILAVFPGLFAMAFLAFAPLCLIDKKLTSSDAIAESAKMVKRGHFRLKLLLLLSLGYSISAMLVFPLMVTLPMYALALAELYDQQHLS